MEGRQPVGYNGYKNLLIFNIFVDPAWKWKKKNGPSKYTNAHVPLSSSEHLPFTLAMFPEFIMSDFSR